MLAYTLILELLQVHTLQGSCSSGSHSCQGILKPVLIVYIEGFPFSPAAKDSQHVGSLPSLGAASACNTGSPELLRLNQALAELCLHAKCGGQLVGVQALAMSNAGAHGGQGTLDAIQQLCRCFLLLSSEGSNFVFAELNTQLLQSGLQVNMHYDHPFKQMTTM